MCVRINNNLFIGTLSAFYEEVHVWFDVQTAARDLSRPRLRDGETRDKRSYTDVFKNDWTVQIANFWPRPFPGETDILEYYHLPKPTLCDIKQWFLGNSALVVQLHRYVATLQHIELLRFWCLKLWTKDEATSFQTSKSVCMLAHAYVCLS